MRQSQGGNARPTATWIGLGSRLEKAVRSSSSILQERWAGSY
jgi:hypothetical protein